MNDLQKANVAMNQAVEWTDERKEKYNDLVMGSALLSGLIVCGLLCVFGVWELGVACVPIAGVIGAAFYK